MCSVIIVEYKMSSADESNVLYKSLLQAIYFVKCQRQRPTVARLYQVVLRQHQTQFRSVSERKIEGILKAAVHRGELITTVKDGCKAYLVCILVISVFVYQSLFCLNW